MVSFLKKNKKKAPSGTGASGPKNQASQSTNLKSTWQEMLKHVYHPSRLQVLEPVKTVTGIVKNTQQEPDGDLHIQLDSGMECEIICMHPVTQPDAIQACQNYKNTVTIPKVGDRVQVTGQHVYDTVHKHEEIHPVFELKIL